jgi:aspartate-semialdehyde dehydrogenase
MLKIAVIGATGLVGTKMLEILEARRFPIGELFLVASPKSIGQSILFKNKLYQVISIEECVAQKPDIALFSAGGTLSLTWAPKFEAAGCTVIDNSSAWRMEKKLIVPEINAHLLSSHDKIIANPNCSTIQMVMVLFPLHQKYKIKRVVVSTYQSVSGTGQKAIQQMMNERMNISGDKVYPHVIDMNALPHIDVFLDNGYTKEEMKMVHETKKIMDDQSIQVTATTVRIPVKGGHSESVNIEFENDFDLTTVRQLLEQTEGVSVLDNPSQNVYPMPIIAEGKDEVFVGRLRRDESQPKSLNCWIVADNLRKGAATNAIQIAEYLVKHKMASNTFKTAQ